MLNEPKNLMESVTLPFGLQKTTAARALSARAAVSIRRNSSESYFRFVLRAALGFAAAFVFAFFAVFFRAIGIGSNSSSDMSGNAPRVSERVHDGQLMGESQLDATTSGDTEKTRASKAQQYQAKSAFVCTRTMRTT